VPTHQVVAVSLPRSGSVSVPRSGSVSVPRSGSADLWDALTAAGRGLTGATRVVVLRAEAGDYIDGVSADGSSEEPPTAAIEWLSRPDVISIASVSGRLAGAGLDAALACDLRIVADDAELSPSRSVSGLMRLGELMGYSRALEFVVTGTAISGQQAVTAGLANLSVGAAMLDATVAQLTATVLRTPREVATAAKAVLSASAADRHRLAGDLASGIALAANEA
jgi:enoyl-CoA hydratase/carnithine racemase